MEINQLKYFVTVARLEHITKAAEQLHIAQPSLSKSISKLEEELGVRLFERDGNRIFLNSYGKVFLRYADQILMQMNNGVKEVKDLAGDTNGSVLVALSIPSIINKFLEDFMLNNPNINITQLAQSPIAMKESLENHEIDIAISSEQITSPNIIWEPLFREEMFLLVSHDHPMASRDSAPLRDFCNDRFICNNSGFGQREALVYFCNQAGFTPKIIFEGNEPVLIGTLVNRNYGINMVPASITRWVERAKQSQIIPVKSLRITEPKCYLTFGIARLKGHYLSKAAIHFYNSVVEFFKDHEISQL